MGGRARVTVRLTELLRRERIADLVCEPVGERPRVLGRVAGGVVIGSDGRPRPADGLWLVRDVLDVQLVDRAGRRGGRVGEVLLDHVVNGLALVAVETGIRPVLARCGIARIWPNAPSRVISWAEIDRLPPGRGHALVTPAAPRRRRYRGVLRARRRAPS